MFRAPKGMLEKKPRHGQPCNNCGLCCTATLCAIGYELFKNKTEPAAFGLGPCPALINSGDGTYACGVVVNPQNYLPDNSDVGEARAAAMLLIGAGVGCDAWFNGEPPDEGFYLTLEKFDHDNRDQLTVARQKWGTE